MSELPKGWIPARFEELFDFKGGTQPPKSEFSDEPKLGYVRLLQIRDFESDAKAVYIRDAERWSKCELDDIMVGRYGASVGKILGGKSGAYNVALVRILMDCHNLSRDWARYYFRSEHFQAPLRQVSRSAQNGFNKQDLAELEIGLPPLEEQRRIVAKLDSLRVRSARARHELDLVPKLIERYKQAILAKAFSGELTKDWREQHPSDASQFMRTTGVAAATNKDADPLPEGWCWVHAGEICAIKSGIALGKKRTADTQLFELPYLRVANVQRGWLNLSEIKTTLVTSREAETLYLKAGDVLMNEGGDRDKLGRGWVWEGQIENCIHQNHVFRLRPNSAQIPSRYISYYANAFGQRYFLDEGKQTTNLASISMSKVSALPIPMCTPNEMMVIVQRIEAAFVWLDKIATEHARAEHLLPKLDQAILAKAFRGELVSQDPNDEPASVLLERIKAEKEGVPTTKRRRAV